MVNQNKLFSFKIKHQAKSVFPRDVERIVTEYLSVYVMITGVCNMALV